MTSYEQLKRDVGGGLVVFLGLCVVLVVLALYGWVGLAVMSIAGFLVYGLKRSCDEG